MLACAKEISAQIPDAKVVLPNAPEKLVLPKDNKNKVLPVPQILKNEDSKVDKYNLRQWFTLEGEWPDVKQNIMKVVPRLNSFIDNQRDILGISNQDIAVLGFSQGGGVGLFATYSRDEPIGCIVAHSTVFMNDSTLKSKTPTYFIYGDKDEEFSQKQYSDIISHLQSYLGSVKTESVKGLKHKTNAESRQKSALFIKKHLAP
jgi:phospholipase/carboxylesterase